MKKPIIPDLHRKYIVVFCAGFVLGSAFMASPALGMVLATVMAVWIISQTLGTH